MEVFKHKEEDNLVLQLTRSSPDGASSSVYQQELAGRAGLRHPNLAHVLGWSQVHMSGPCGQSQVVNVYSEFHEHDLSREIAKRAREEDKFEEAEVWYMAQSLISVMAFLNREGIFHGDLKSSQVFLSEEGFAKVYDHGMMSALKTNFQKQVTTRERGYLAPEQIEMLGEPVGLVAPWDNYKADVYGLGMTLLEMVTLVDPLSKIYGGDIDHEKIEELLYSALKNGYSSMLVDFIRRMLIVNPLQRLSIADCEAMLNPVRSQITQRQPVTITQLQP